MKRVRYTNKDYCISFGNEDVVEVELELVIRQVTSPEVDQPDQYEIEKLSITPVVQQEFINYLFSLLTPERQQEVYAKLLELIRKELEQELFSLFHVGDIIS